MINKEDFTDFTLLLLLLLLLLMMLGIKDGTEIIQTAAIRISTLSEKDIESLRAGDLVWDSIANRQTIKGRLNNEIIIMIIIIIIYYIYSATNIQ